MSENNYYVFIFDVQGETVKTTGRCLEEAIRELTPDQQMNACLIDKYDL